MGLFGKEKLEDMEGLLLAQVKDLYDAECRIIDSIPDIVEKASSNHLKNALSSHLIETIQHKKRLEEIFETLEETAVRETCKATKGLIDEVNDTISRDGNPDVLDAALIAAVQRIEHYEISAYGSAKAFANICGENHVADLLSLTLAEEHEADKKLNMLANGSINDKAGVANLS